jgi:hypothetical protein
MREREIESIMLINWYYVGCKLHKPKSINTEFVGKYLYKKINRNLIIEHDNFSPSIIRKTFAFLLIILVKFKFSTIIF